MPKSVKHNSMINKVVVNVNSYNKKTGRGGGRAAPKSGFNGNLPSSSSISNVTYPPNYYSPFRDAIQQQHQTLEPTPQGIKQKQPSISDNNTESSSIENSYNELEKDIEMNKLKQNFLLKFEENQQYKSPLTAYNLSRVAAQLELGKHNNNANKELFKPSSVDLNSNTSEKRDLLEVFPSNEIVHETISPMRDNNFNEAKEKRYDKLQEDLNNIPSSDIKLKEIKVINNLDNFVKKINDKIVVNPQYKLTKEEKKELGELYKSDLMGKKLTGNIQYARTAIGEIVKHKKEIDEQKVKIIKRTKKKEEAIKKDALQRFPSSNTSKIKGLSEYTYKGPIPQTVNTNQLLQSIRESKKK
jgi:hypothetical protein